MSIVLTLAKLQPFLPTLSTAQTTRVNAWIPVLQALLNGRYGDSITQEPDGGNEPVFVSFSADAIERRLERPRGMIDQQSVGPASVRYNSRANLARWFLDEELDQMDGLTGGGGARTVRTPAPDEIRYGNLVSSWPATVDESGEGDVLIGGT